MITIKIHTIFVSFCFISFMNFALISPLFCFVYLFSDFLLISPSIFSHPLLGTIICLDGSHTFMQEDEDDGDGGGNYNYNTNRRTGIVCVTLWNE